MNTIHVLALDAALSNLSVTCAPYGFALLGGYDSTGAFVPPTSFSEVRAFLPCGAAAIPFAPPLTETKSEFSFPVPVISLVVITESRLPFPGEVLSVFQSRIVGDITQRQLDDNGAILSLYFSYTKEDGSTAVQFFAPIAHNVDLQKARAIFPDGGIYKGPDGYPGFTPTNPV